MRRDFADHKTPSAKKNQKSKAPLPLSIVIQSGALTMSGNILPIYHLAVCLVMDGTKVIWKTTRREGGNHNLRLLQLAPAPVPAPEPSDENTPTTLLARTHETSSDRGVGVG